MKQEDKELLLKDLCARLPYWVKVQVCNATEYTPILKGILGDDLFLQFDYITKPIKNGDSTYNLIEDNIKPYLRPMSSMTEKEKDEYNRFIFDYEYDDYWNPGKYRDAVEVYMMDELIDWLNVHHFDYSELIERLGITCTRRYVQILNH